MAGNRAVNFTPPQPWGAPGWTPSSDRAGRCRPDDRKGEGRTFANSPSLRATSWGWRSAGPRRQRPRPAHGARSGGASRPPEPSPATLAGGSRSGAARARLGDRSTWPDREGEARRGNMRCRGQRASRSGLRPPSGHERGRTVRRSRLLRKREGRSPLGSPLPWGMARDAEELGALRRPQGLSSALTGLREPLTPPPRQAAPGPELRT
jgi:hypothetical protein